MKKQFLILILVTTLVSCTTIRQIKNQKIETRTNCSGFVSVNNKMIYRAKIDGHEQSFLFDTGATLSVLTDSTVTDMRKKELGNLGSAKLANNQKVKLQTMTASFDSELFQSNNKVFAYINAPKSKCNPDTSYKGILGMDAFFKNDNPLFLDFSNSKICNISLLEKNELIKKDYIELKSECKSKQIFVFVTLFGKEYKFKLDTGFVGAVIFPSTEFVQLSNYNTLAFEGSLFKTVTSNTYGTDVFIENIPVTIGSATVNSNVIQSTSVGDHDNYLLGYSFIKGFDWIIDYNNNKVYVKRNGVEIKNKLDADFFKYAVYEKEQKLYVLVKQKKENDFQVGDQIIAVEGVTVTPENICRLQDLLNTTRDWKSLNISISPAKRE
jgi:hypothetical protein